MTKAINHFLILSLLSRSFADAKSEPQSESRHVDGGRCEDMRAGLSLNLRDVGLRRLDSGFSESPHITCLNLEDNDITYVCPSSFNSLPNLLYLNLARNHLSLGNFSNLDTLPRLRTLILDGNSLGEGVTLDFVNAFPELSYLYIRNCSIEDITSLLFAPRLLYLNLSSNILGKSKLGFLDVVPATLTAIDLAYNGIENLNASSLSSVTRLRLDGNQFVRLCGKSYCSEAVLMLEGVTNLRWLSASNNALTSVDSDAFDDTANIVHLDLSHNKINSIQKGTFEKLEELKYLSLEDNLLKTIPELCNLESLRHLQLAKNFLPAVNSDSFCQIENLTFVDLSDNKIKFVEEGALDKLVHLEILKLSNNLLTTFSSSWLERLKNLRSLYVDGNRLKSLSDLGLAAVHMFAKLEHVYAQNNWIAQLYTGSLLTEVRNQPNVTIQLFDFTSDVQKNLLSAESRKCDCSCNDNEIFFL
ncbi:leucine-rich repeat-containing protein egg-6-like [Phymastichus coffea]|uniref:leucine-rich repeat-containing protein egg-6-like n=1 Tax=Phymastichus coffea TaxID=108790 RepID=UPI00273BFAC2|nr:leucine-rich repeat-containing protein egg-6-like [Phymastichus coffea]